MVLLVNKPDPSYETSIWLAGRQCVVAYGNDLGYYFVTCSGDRILYSRSHPIFCAVFRGRYLDYSCNGRQLHLLLEGPISQSIDAIDVAEPYNPSRLRDTSVYDPDHPWIYTVATAEAVGLRHESYLHY